MFFVGVAFVAVGYALAYTGATKLRTRGGAPSLLYNLAISTDATPGKVLDSGSGAGDKGSGPTIVQDSFGTTPIAPAMPSPTFGATPVLAV